MPPPITIPPRSPAPYRIKTIGRQVRPFDDIYHFVLDRSWAEYIGLLVAGFLAVNTLFAALFRLDAHAIVGARPGSFEDCFYFSVQTLATIGYGTMAPATRYAHILVVVEAITGTLSLALVAGITFAKFARPTSRVLFSRVAVAVPRDGTFHLMFRMANWRHNQIFDAHLRVIVLVTETTADGEQWRRPIELALVRATTAVFLLTWTGVHRIDDNSPFYGDGAVDKLRALRAEIIVTLSGTDETIGQPIFARHGYALDDIVWGARFADSIQVEADGTRIVDYRRFHDVIRLSTDGVPADR